MIHEFLFMIVSLIRALDTVKKSITNKLQNKERKKTYIAQHQLKTEIYCAMPRGMYS